MIQTAFGYIAVACLSVLAGYSWAEVERERLKTAHDKLLAEATAEIKRLRAQVANLVGKEP